MWTMLAYQDAAMRTNGITEPMVLTVQEAMMLNASTGMAGEAGEVSDIVKKHIFHKHPLNKEQLEKLEKEIGDVMWYCAMMAEAISTTLDAIVEKNIRKLQDRYPSGFDPQLSLFRNDWEPMNNDSQIE